MIWFDLVYFNSEFGTAQLSHPLFIFFSCLTVQKLIKEVDSKDMQLRELSSFSSSQIIDALKPELAKVNLLADQVKSLTETVNALDSKNATDIRLLMLFPRLTIMLLLLKINRTTLLGTLAHLELLMLVHHSISLGLYLLCTGYWMKKLLLFLGLVIKSAKSAWMDKQAQ